MKPFPIGSRIQIPVHYELWMMGARFGTITAYRNGKPGISACMLVKMDNPKITRRCRVWKLDWPYVKIDRGAGFEPT